MKKIKIVSMIVFLLLIITTVLGCSQSFSFPNEKDFSLTAGVSKTKLKVGEELEVNAVFKNLTDSNYELVNSFATFSNSGLIGINLVKIDEPELFLVGVARGANIDAKQEIVENNKFKMKHTGKYKVIVAANFDIQNSKTQENKSYNYNIDPIIIEVE